MTEQVIFRMDKKLKELVMKKAKQEGTTLSHVLKEAAHAYAENHFEVGLVYKPSFIRALRRVESEPTLRGDIKKLLRK
jgi:hypothetical protein